MINLGSFLTLSPRTPQEVACRQKVGNSEYGGANHQTISRHTRCNTRKCGWVTVKCLMLEQFSCRVRFVFPRVTSLFPRVVLFSPRGSFLVVFFSFFFKLLKKKKNIQRRRGKWVGVCSRVLVELVKKSPAGYMSPRALFRGFSRVQKLKLFMHLTHEYHLIRVSAGFPAPVLLLRSFHVTEIQIEYDCFWSQEPIAVGITLW